MRGKMMAVFIAGLLGLVLLAVILWDLNGGHELNELVIYQGEFSFFEEHKRVKRNSVAYWTLGLADGTQLRVNTNIGFDVDAFFEKVSLGDELTILAESGEPAWVMEIKRCDEMVHPLERSLNGKAENRRLGNIIVGGLAVMLVLCEIIGLCRMYNLRKRGQDAV